MLATSSNLPLCLAGEVNPLKLPPLSLGHAVEKTVTKVTALLGDIKVRSIGRV